MDIAGAHLQQMHQRGPTGNINMISQCERDHINGPQHRKFVVPQMKVNAQQSCGVHYTHALSIACSSRSEKCRVQHRNRWRGSIGSTRLTCFNLCIALRTLWSLIILEAAVDTARLPNKVDGVPGSELVPTTHNALPRKEAKRPRSAARIWPVVDSTSLRPFVRQIMKRAMFKADSASTSSGSTSRASQDSFHPLVLVT